MIRPILAIIAGYALWSVLWVGGGVGLAFVFPDEYEYFADGGSIVSPTYLLSSLALSLICSWLAGLTTSRVSRQSHRGAVLIMAVCLIATGLFVQLGVWERMPVWYHLAFLICLLPVCLLGAGTIKPAQS